MPDPTARTEEARGRTLRHVDEHGKDDVIAIAVDVIAKKKIERLGEGAEPLPRVRVYVRLGLGFPPEFD